MAPAWQVDKLDLGLMQLHRRKQNNLGPSRDGQDVLLAVGPWQCQEPHCTRPVQEKKQLKLACLASWQALSGEFKIS